MLWENLPSNEIVIKLLNHHRTLICKQLFSSQVLFSRDILYQNKLETVFYPLSVTL